MGCSSSTATACGASKPRAAEPTGSEAVSEAISSFTKSISSFPKSKWREVADEDDASGVLLHLGFTVAGGSHKTRKYLADLSSVEMKGQVLVREMDGAEDMPIQDLRAVPSSLDKSAMMLCLPGYRPGTVVMVMVGDGCKFGEGDRVWFKGGEPQGDNYFDCYADDVHRRKVRSKAEKRHDGESDEDADDYVMGIVLGVMLSKRQ